MLPPGEKYPFVSQRSLPPRSLLFRPPGSGRTRLFHKFCRPPRSLAFAYLAPGEPAWGRHFPRSRARPPKRPVALREYLRRTLAGMNTRLIPDIASPERGPFVSQGLLSPSSLPFTRLARENRLRTRDFRERPARLPKMLHREHVRRALDGDAYAVNRGDYLPGRVACFASQPLPPELADFRPTAPERTLTPGERLRDTAGGSAETARCFTGNMCSRAFPVALRTRRLPCGLILRASCPFVSLRLLPPSSILGPAWLREGRGFAHDFREPLRRAPNRALFHGKHSRPRLRGVWRTRLVTGRAARLFHSVCSQRDLRAPCFRPPAPRGEPHSGRAASAPAGASAKTFRCFTGNICARAYKVNRD